MPKLDSRRLGKSTPLGSNGSGLTRFGAVSEAYQILSDPNSRAFYDKVGKTKMSEVAGEEGMEMQDPSALFSSLFGGERFKDLIGEISLVKGSSPDICHKKAC
jgi:DnaJ-class molecular chaperone